MDSNLHHLPRADGVLLLTCIQNPGFFKVDTLCSECLPRRTFPIAIVHRAQSVDVEKSQDMVKPACRLFCHVPVCKIAKKKVSNPTDCFFGDFAHWDELTTCAFYFIRLRHNVIKTGIRMISLSYSRIALNDIASKLCLDSAEDAEFIVSKVCRMSTTYTSCVCCRC